MVKKRAADGMGGHQRPGEGATDDWLTPPGLVGALGPFDLDPCASVGQPWPTARTMLTRHDDGLSLYPWWGTVWLNPPYGRDTWTWLGRLADHGDGIALVFARTETDGFWRTVWQRADGLYFLKGRLHFHRPVTGERAASNAGSPSVLVGYGGEACRRLRQIDRTAWPGRYVSNVVGWTAPTRTGGNEMTLWVVYNRDPNDGVTLHAACGSRDAAEWVRQRLARRDADLARYTVEPVPAADDLFDRLNPRAEGEA